jgi:osmotically-inducible protein OsmY
VTLSGTTATYASKDEAGDAAHRVRGVRGVTNDVTVAPDLSGARSDDAIERDVVSALTLDVTMPADRISVDVDDGKVTLSGSLDYYYQRKAAEDDASRIAGVTGIVDLITVDQPSLADNISNWIASAFARNGELADDNIAVSVNGATVVLDGSVRTWGEFKEAAATAWRAPGVGHVINNILVAS